MHVYGLRINFGDSDPLHYVKYDCISHSLVELLEARISKGLLRVIFLWAGAFNFYTAFSNPSVYLELADTTFLGFLPRLYSGGADHVVLIVSAIALTQLCISL